MSCNCKLGFTSLFGPSADYSSKSTLFARRLAFWRVSCGLCTVHLLLTAVHWSGASHRMLAPAAPTSLTAARSSETDSKQQCREQCKTVVKDQEPMRPEPSDLQRGLIRVRHGATTPPRCLLLHPLPRIRVQTSDRTNPCSPRSLNNPQQPPAASSAAYGPPLVGATHPLPPLQPPLAYSFGAAASSAGSTPRLSPPPPLQLPPRASRLPPRRRWPRLRRRRPRRKIERGPLRMALRCAFSTSQQMGSPERCVPSRSSPT